MYTHIHTKTSSIQGSFQFSALTAHPPETLQLYVFFRTVGPAFMHAIQQRLGVADEEFKEGNPSFFEALENQEISGLDTYNIKKNPRYRDAFSSEIVEVDDDDEGDSDDDDDFGAASDDDD